MIDVQGDEHGVVSMRHGMLGHVGVAVGRVVGGIAGGIIGSKVGKSIGEGVGSWIK